MLSLPWYPKKKEKKKVSDIAAKALNGHDTEEEDEYIEPEDEIASLKAENERLKEELESAALEIKSLRDKIYSQQEWTQQLVMQLIAQQGTKPRTMAEEYLAKKGFAAIDDKAKGK